MAQVHILDRLGDGTFRVALHIPIPSANNTVNVNWRTALINSGIGGKTVLPDGDGTAGTISADEKTDLASGALYEVVETWELLSGGPSGAQVNTLIDTLYARRQTAVLAALQNRLGQFGYTRNTP